MTDTEDGTSSVTNQIRNGISIMIRIGLVLGLLAVLAMIPLFIVESEQVFVAWSWLALSLGGLGAFFLIGRLLEKIAPATPVDEYEENPFRPRHEPRGVMNGSGRTNDSARRAA